MYRAWELSDFVHFCRFKVMNKMLLMKRKVLCHDLNTLLWVCFPGLQRSFFSTAVKEPQVASWPLQNAFLAKIPQDVQLKRNTTNCRETTVPLPNLALFVIKKFQEVPQGIALPQHLCSGKENNSITASLQFFLYILNERFYLYS